MRYEHNGKATVLADKFEGQELNAPNDAVVHPNDGSIWFTDPGYGSLMEYEGNRLPQSASTPRPLRKEAIYRIDKSGAIAKVADEPFKPNGLCFSHDYSKLYVADTGVSHYPEAQEHHLGLRRRRREAEEPARRSRAWSSNGKSGFADGIRCDEDGNVWSSAGWVGDGYDGVHIFAPDGARIGQIRLPEICSNVCFGGTQAQPAVHDRKPIALRGLCRDARRAYHVSNGFRGRVAGKAARPR